MVITVITPNLKMLSSSEHQNLLHPHIILVSGESVFTTRELSEHAKTNMWLVEKFLDVKLEVEQKEGLEEVRVRGIG